MIPLNKLLVIGNSFPSENGDSKVGYNIKEWVDLIKNRFDEIIVVIPTPYFPNFMFKGTKIWNEKNKSSNYSYDNVNVHFVKYYTLPFNSVRKIKGLIASYYTIKYLVNKNIQFDIVHAHFTWVAGYVSYEISKRFNVKYYLTVRENHKWLKKLYYENNRYYQKTWRSSEAIFRVNNLDIPLLKNYNKNVIHSPNSVDTLKFDILDKKECRNNLNINETDRIILHVGYYRIEHKNQINIIRALKHLCLTKDKEYKLYMIGVGPDEQVIQNYIDDCGMGDYVKLVGGVENSDIPIWMNAANLFILPSYSESFGIALIEAMACGLPVITTKNGGSEEIVTDSVIGCVLQDPDDYMSLANTIEVYIDKGDVAISRNREVVINSYARSIVSKKYTDAYNLLK